MSMNIQIYMVKRDFAVQKAERFFKERRIAYQLVDLKKQRIGAREIQLFAGKAGVRSLLNTSDPKVKEHPACYASDENDVLQYLIDRPELMRLPIIRNGREFTFGADESVWQRWIGK